MHMLSFETIANLISLAVIVSLAGVYFYGKKRFEPAASDREMDGAGGGNP